ncbi:hypothetical protein V2K65_00440 [Pseudomonas alliivorans]|nr:hypothetical protein [Pseudomonas alliivorans]
MTDVPIGLVGIFIILPLIVNLIAIAVIAHKYVGAIEGYLPNCSAVSTIKEAWSGGGLLGKVIRGGMIAIVIMMPNISARRGVIDKDEVSRLPAFYKRVLVIPMVINFFLFAALMGLRFAGYLLGL